jgi:hypothetical protein
MTEQKAYKIIGVSRNCTGRKALEAYNKKKTKLQLQLRNGMSKTVRTQAADKLKELTTAWDTINKTSKGRTRKKTSARKNPSQQPANPPDDLGQAWGDFMDLIPLPKPLVVTIMVFFALWVIAALFRNL